MKYIQKIKSKLIRLRIPGILKTSLKKLQIFTISGITSLGIFVYNYTPVLADGVIDGVDVGTDGKITIDIGEAGATGNAITLEDGFNKLFDSGDIIITGLGATLTIAMIGVFMFKAFELARSGDNPKKRSDAISGLIFAGIGTALIGGATILIGFAYNVFI